MYPMLQPLPIPNSAPFALSVHVVDADDTGCGDPEWEYCKSLGRAMQSDM